MQIFAYFLLAVAVLAVLGLLIYVFSGGAKTPDYKKTDTPIKANSIMTEHEKIMFSRLREALPHCFIFPQVSFNALLTTASLKTRNTFNRKMADFVIMDKSMKVLAVVELDDSSHKGKEQSDRQRDLMLNHAGYRTLRYARLPEVSKVRIDFNV